jgi:hypothetical protein
MSNWTVRTRIIGAFAAVITIMIALGAVSYAGLQTIRAQARQIENDVLPGVVISAKSQTLARELLLAITKHSAALTARDKQLSGDRVEQLLQVALQNDEAYQVLPSASCSRAWGATVPWAFVSFGLPGIAPSRRTRQRPPSTECPGRQPS